MMNQMVELAGDFISLVQDGLKFFIVQVALIVGDVKLGPYFPGGCLGRSEEVDKLRTRMAFESFRDIGHYADGRTSDLVFEGTVFSKCPPIRNCIDFIRQFPGRLPRPKVFKSLSHGVQIAQPW